MLDSEILPPAHADFDESYAWYAKQSLVAAERFAAELDAAIEKSVVIRRSVFASMTSTGFIV